MNDPISLNPPTSLLKSGLVTRERVYARTRELAMKAGRTALQVTQADYEQARHELTGEFDMVRQEAVLDTTSAASPVATWDNEGGRVADSAA